MRVIINPRSMSRTPVLASLLCVAMFLPAVVPPASAADPTTPVVYSLPTIVELALARHPTVASAQGVIQQQQGNRRAAAAYPNPSVNGNTGRGEIRDAGRGGIADGAAQSITEYNVTIGQPLEWPAKRAARQRAAEAGLAGAQAGLAETQLNLAAEVKIAFYDLLFAQRDLELAKQNVAIVEDVQRIVKARVRLGEAPQLEAIKAEVEVMKANQVVTRAERTVRVSRVILDTLTAGALGHEYAITGQFLRYPRDLSLERLARRALEEHPTIQRLAQFVEQADRSLEHERQARVPNITVSGSYWREIGREAFQGGLTIPTPLWYQRQGEILSAFGAKRREEAELLRARQELLRAVNQHHEDSAAAAALIDVFEKGLLKQAQEALRIAQFSFQQGAASLLEVLDAQRVQRQILLDYAQAQFDLSIALVRLERAAGGTL